jgi:hypothetical protein
MCLFTFCQNYLSFGPYFLHFDPNDVHFELSFLTLGYNFADHIVYAESVF